jgi:hypothetical protein
MFRITVERTSNGDSFTFLGQGDSIKAACDDGLKNCGESFRPKNDGRPPKVNTIGVVRANGARVTMTLREFEAERAKASDVEAVDI